LGSRVAEVDLVLRNGDFIKPKVCELIPDEKGIFIVGDGSCEARLPGEEKEMLCQTERDDDAHLISDGEYST